MSEQSDEAERVLRFRRAREVLAQRAADVRSATAAASDRTWAAGQLAMQLHERACEEYVAAHEALQASRS